MEIITAPLGGMLNTLFALGAVIVGIVLVLWLLKLLTGAAGNVTRGRNRRLAVVDSLALDPKRQLLIVRRDNVEHLILVGGPQDVVVETGIAVEEAVAAQPARRPVPMAAARKPVPAKVPPATATPVPAVTPVVAQPPAESAAAAPATAIERLRDMGLPTNKRAHLSLRHTGLLRPVSDMEMPLSPENSPASVVAASDSAKEETARRDVEGTDLVEDTSEANRN
jgi:flagellar protein FliO/FliZ